MKLRNQVPTFEPTKSESDSYTNILSDITTVVEWDPTLNSEDPQRNVFQDYKRIKEHNKVITHHHPYRTTDIFLESHNGKKIDVCLGNVTDTEYQYKYEVLCPSKDGMTSINNLRDKYQES